MSSRARVLVLNSALGPLDYRVPHGMNVEPGSIVIAPLGPRQLLGVVWEPERMPSDAEVGDNRLRNLVGVVDVPPLADPLRRLVEWTADYYLAPPASVVRMAMPSSSALEGARTVTEYRATGLVPDRMTPQREQALERIGDRQGWSPMSPRVPFSRPCSTVLQGRARPRSISRRSPPRSAKGGRLWSCCPRSR